MISRLDPGNILRRLAVVTLSTSKRSSRSWFLQVRDLCAKYSITDPLAILSNPPTKYSFNRTAKSKIVDFWEKKLRSDAALLSSLNYFKAEFYSLAKPHPIWTTAGNNPHEAEKACCQARMISGRFRTCWLARHWSGDPSGSCSLPTCHLNPTPGTLTHILLHCEDLSVARQRIYSLWAEYLRDKPYLFPIVRRYTANCSDTERMQFILDCSVLPDVIALHQRLGTMVHDSLFYLTRSLCFSIDKTRSKLLGRWNVQQW